MDADDIGEGKYEVAYSNLKRFWDTFGPQFVGQQNEQMKLDGKTVSMPTWQSVWNPYK